MSIGDIADPCEAVAQWLSERLPSVPEGKFFTPELPEVDDKEVPTKAVVVMPAGGGKLFGATRMPVYDSLIDILCYGATRLQADTVARQAAGLLRLLQTTSVQCPEAQGKVLLHWARIASGEKPRELTQTNWPYTEFTIQIMHSEVVLA